MKHIMKYRYLLINNKLTGDLRLVLDRNPEYVSKFDNGVGTNLTIYPIIGLSIIKNEIDSDGRKIKAPWNANDHLSMTKFTLPIMIRELESIEKDMMIPDLYRYNNNVLELNTDKSELVRRVFIIGNTTLELSPIILEEDEKRLEAVKIKFNNESSIVALTINELRSLIYNLDHLDVDHIAMQLYFNYGKGNFGTDNINLNTNVDIVPPKRIDTI